ncbi:hypothetical protein V6N12_024928 [Hibiscus sabdariffa]|uniref:Uncharacterized protein n=1 Tax=Hibiscus sabdariffa TaxID=183260 RepID=A0ABR2ANE1_9ROSI
MDQACSRLGSSIDGSCPELGWELDAWIRSAGSMQASSNPGHELGCLVQLPKGSKPFSYFASSSAEKSVALPSK